MKVYLAGEISLKALEKTGVYDAFFAACKNRLFTYFYHDDPKEPEIQEYLKRGVSLFLDSGAFSAYTQKSSVDMDKYAAYIKDCPFYYPVANLDEVGGTGQVSFDNMLKLCDMVGKDRILPVFHESDDDFWLDKILDMGFTYIAFSGLVKGSWTRLERWFDKSFPRICDKNGVPFIKIHGFGHTTMKALIGYPWYSVDSSSWMQSAIYGGCVFLRDKKLTQIIFSNESPDIREINSRHYNSLPQASKDAVDSWLQEIGVTAQQCAVHWVPRAIVNAYTFSRLDELAPTKFTVKQETLFA